MSFSHDVKSELCAVNLESVSSKKAEIYGLLLFGRNLSPNSIVLQTEHDGVVRIAAQLLSELYPITPQSRVSGRADGSGLVTLAIESKTESNQVFTSFGYAPNVVSLRINHANIDNEEDVSAFLRGVFLSCGTIVDPEKDYHLEFVTPFLNLSRDLAKILADMGFEPKSVTRKGNYVVYFKDSEQIEDVLTFMGAAHQSLELMNIKVYKDLRNKANRVTNCETANIEKTINAAVAQVEAIKKLMQSHEFDDLPDELREIAQLRIQNPDISLRELGKLLSTPLSRSGVNHRLNKLIQKAGLGGKFQKPLPGK